MTDKPSLKEKTYKGILWNAVEKFSVKGIKFIIGIILARLLIPEDFGLIGMIAVFIAISQTFIDSGMMSGLIQKQGRSNKDFSTVFVFNFGLSVLAYILLYVSAKYIALFYNTPVLIPIIKVVGINIIINALAIVQRARLIINMDFRTLAKVTISSEIISGFIAIYLAYNGYGVWSLVIKQIIVSIITLLLLWYLSRWKPSLLFSKQSFKNLFGFGSKLLIAGIYAQVMHQIYNVFIGKYYSAGQLGNYTQGKQLAVLPAETISGIIYQVTFPLLSGLQNDTTKMISVFRSLLKMSAFVMFPCMTGIAILAEPFITLFLGQKWLMAIPLMQWMCFARIFYAQSVLNLNILNAIGRSDLFLKVDLSKAPIGIIILLFTLPISVEAMVIGQVISSTINFYINTYLPGKLFGHGVLSQLKDIWPTMALTVVMSIIILLSISLVETNILRLIVGVVAGLISYIGISHLLKLEELKEVKKLLRTIGK
ncbi:lipopolysaccharide biosynthesis protein [uncultured Eudoraea sp.]|uniref:lipopolysaccharide biosynthesis protein n=1 Tax=uncultured Eudoraea sp. TaxID=1035614 RepID=UPI002626F273|nr:lipopolysaccharide biosynthesis protein [uncultured Eudoraea sp.]